MDFSHEAGVDAARKRVAAGAAASAVRRELDDRRRAPPPPHPRAAEGRRGDVGGGGPGKAAEDAGGGRRATSLDVGGGGSGSAARDARAAADGARDARRGGGPGKAAEDAGGGGRAASRGGGASRSGVVNAAGVAGASPGDGAHGVAVVAAAPREGRGGGGEVRSKRPFASAASPRAHPPPERRKVPASPRSRPVGGRGTDDGCGSRLVAAPARAGLGGSAALPKKPAAALPRSVGDAGSSAAAVPRPIARGGHPRRDAGALRSPEPPRRRKVAAADGFSDTASQGGSGSGGFVRGKGLVPAKMLLPKPTTAIRRFGPGRGRVTASQPVNKSADKSPCTESNELSTARGSASDLRMRVASACRMGSINKPEDIAASILGDNCFSRELADHEKELQKKFNVSSYDRLDARTKVMMMRARFKFICDATVKFVEERSQKVGRIDLTADNVIKKLPGFKQPDPMIGNVPGVEIGDEFVYRVELALVGLHGPPRGGIGTTKDGSGVLVAVSIVASGRYPDELSSSGELVYTGSGGKLAGKKDDENQKLERGNLGLKNCIETLTPVRVIYGLKRSREKGSHPRPKGASSFIYDGLYHVVGCWREGQAGAKVFKFKLQRIPEQPQLHYSSKIGIMCGRRNH